MFRFRFGGGEKYGKTSLFPEIGKQHFSVNTFPNKYIIHTHTTYKETYKLQMRGEGKYDDDDDDEICVSQG